MQILQFHKENSANNKDKPLKMIACLLVLRDGKPTGTIILQNADCFENETASWSLRAIVSLRWLGPMDKSGLRIEYRSTGMLG